jgi:hypothetical protein
MTERCAYCNKPSDAGYLREKPFGHFKIGDEWLPFCSTQCKHAYERVRENDGTRNDGGSGAAPL